MEVERYSSLKELFIDPNLGFKSVGLRLLQL